VLPSNLLVARVRGRRIEPVLLEPEGLALAIAEEVLARLRDGVGKSRDELIDELADLEELALESGMDLRIVRAMATLALRRSKFERVQVAADPLRLRLMIFEAASNAFGIVTSEEERREVLRRVAEQTGYSVEKLEGVLSRYLEEELVEPPDLRGEDLVREYNLSMVQTLLFKALRLEVRLESDGAGVKRLLRAVKRLGLLYIAEKCGSGVLLSIDGPASLLRQTRRYGTRLAKLVPYVMEAGRWALRAEVERGSRVLLFELDARSSHLFPPRAEVEEEPLFDSELERRFYRSLSALVPEWVVRREPEPLVVGNKIFIPDFSVTYNGRKVYIEVVGFWTKEYLERKLQKLRELKDVKIVVAVDEELACSSFTGLPHEVVLFRRVLRGSDVYPVLKRLLGVPTRPREAQAPSPNLEIPSNVPDLEGKTLREAAALLRSLGVDEAHVEEVLRRLGYVVVWSSLDPARAIVRRAGEQAISGAP